MIIILGSFLLFLVVLLYLAVGFGAPFGFLVMGGKYEKVLPKKLRIQVLISVPAQLFAIYVLLKIGGFLSEIESEVVPVFGYVFMIYFLVNTALNLMSKSKYEKWIMTPIAAIVCASYITAIFFG